jgi:hypothetical protein
MTAAPNPWPEPLRRAFEGVWKDRAELVGRLRLSYEPGGTIRESVLVLVRCDDPRVNPTELVRAFREIEADVAARLARAGLDLDVTLTMQSPDDRALPRSA